MSFEIKVGEKLAFTTLAQSFEHITLSLQQLISCFLTKAGYFILILYSQLLRTAR